MVKALFPFPRRRQAGRSRSFAAPCEASVGSASLSRESHRQAGGSFALAHLRYGFSNELPFVKVKTTVSSVPDSVKDLRISTGVRPRSLNERKLIQNKRVLLHSTAHRSPPPGPGSVCRVRESLQSPDVGQRREAPYVHSCQSSTAPTRKASTELFGCRVPCSAKPGPQCPRHTRSPVGIRPSCCRSTNPNYSYFLMRATSSALCTTT